MAIACEIPIGRGYAAFFIPYMVRGTLAQKEQHNLARRNNVNVSKDKDPLSFVEALVDFEETRVPMPCRDYLSRFGEDKASVLYQVIYEPYCEPIGRSISEG